MYGVTIYILGFFRPSPRSVVSRQYWRRGIYSPPLLLSTAISLSCKMLGCDSIFRSLISRRAVIGNFRKEPKKNNQIIISVIRMWHTHPIFLIVHEYFLQSNDGPVLFRPCLVNLAGRVSADWIVDNTKHKGITHPKVPSPSFPKNSKSRMFEQPWNLVWPLLSLSKEVLRGNETDRAISSEVWMQGVHKPCLLRALATQAFRITRDVKSKETVLLT